MRIELWDGTVLGPKNKFVPFSAKVAEYEEERRKKEEEEKKKSNSRKKSHTSGKTSSDKASGTSGKTSNKTVASNTSATKTAVPSTEVQKNGVRQLWSLNNPQQQWLQQSLLHRINPNSGVKADLKSVDELIEQRNLLEKVAHHMQPVNNYEDEQQMPSVDE